VLLSVVGVGLSVPALAMLLAGAAGLGAGLFGILAYRRSSGAAVKLIEMLDELTRERERLQTRITEWAADEQEDDDG
jgi:hypothetical protein